MTNVRITRLQDGRLVSVVASHGSSLQHDSGCYICGSSPWMMHKDGCPTWKEPKAQPEQITLIGNMSAEEFVAYCKDVPGSDAALDHIPFIAEARKVMDELIKLDINFEYACWMLVNQERITYGAASDRLQEMERLTGKKLGR